MKNEILDEIYRVREEIARECNFDVDIMFARMRANLENLKAEGWQIVSPAPRKNQEAWVLREEPPKP